MGKSLGRYLWGRRAYSGIGIGRCKFNKKLTTGIERMRERALIIKESEVAMDYESHNAFWQDTWAN